MGSGGGLSGQAARSTGCSQLQGTCRFFELILSHVHDVAERTDPISHTRGRVDVHACRAEAPVNVRERAELVVALHEQRVVRPVECERIHSRLGHQLVRIFREDRELCAVWPAWHGGEGEEVDTKLRKGRQHAVSRPELVANVRVVILDLADPVRHESILAPHRAVIAVRCAGPALVWLRVRAGATACPGAVEPATPLCPYRAYREDVQATVATFSTDTHSGTVLLDTGARLA